MDITGIAEIFLQWGILGVFALIMLLFSKYLFKYFISMFNEERAKTEQLNREYKEKLAKINEEHLEVIRENTKVIRQFSNMMQRYIDFKERESKNRE